MCNLPLSFASTCIEYRSKTDTGTITAQVLFFATDVSSQDTLKIAVNPLVKAEVALGNRHIIQTP
jgi:hypothetical protein